MTGATPPCSSAQRVPGASLRPQTPTDARTADEAEEGDAAIGGEPFGERVIAVDNWLAPLVGQAGFAENLDESQAGERRRFGRFDHDRATGGDGRADLVHDQVERVIEGAERQHGTDRFESRHGEPAGRGGVEAHGDLAAMLGAERLDAAADAVDGPIDFHA